MPRVFFVSTDQRAVSALEGAFAGVEGVSVSRINISQSPVNGPDVVIATASNSAGLMDGGIDRTVNYMLSSPFHMISTDVKERIRTYFYGEQPVGTCMIIPSLHSVAGFLAHVPTMRVPKDVSKTYNAYLAFRALLVSVLNHNKIVPSTPINSIVCPSFCTGAGEMPHETAARQMRLAWDSAMKISSGESAWVDVWASERALEATIAS